MSGICGIFCLDGAPPEGIRPMLTRLERRGPDGSHVFQSGPVALGHATLNTTPESLHELQPFPHPGSGCVITADLRLDNRKALIAAFGLAGAAQVIGDAELVLLSYLKWGEDCPTHLLGDFAFAIWDPREERLFCARDHMGMKQLIWHRSEGRIFAFASTPEAVLKAESVPKRVNEGRIADFLEDYLEGIDFTSTFFKEVFRLAPGHCLTVTRNRLGLRRYWTLEPGSELKLGSDQEYGEAFLEVFTQAVKDRLRVNGAIGSMLSGGMDSGSVAAVAAKLLHERGGGPLHTLSCLGPDPQTCIETATARAAINHLPGITPHIADYTRLEPCLDDLIRLSRDSDEPFDGHMTLVRAAYLMAHRQGLRVVLDGVSGDSALPLVSRAAREWRRGNVLQAWREAKGSARFWGGTPLRDFLASGREAFTPNLLRHLRDMAYRQRAHLPQDGLLDPDFAQQVDLAARNAAFHRHNRPGMQSKAAQHLSALSHPFVVVARERYDRVASALGIEPRDPFLDRRLLSLCLRLPAAQIDHDGWIKIVLRRAMQGLLPDEVRWRHGKQHLGAVYTYHMLQAWPGWQKLIGQQPLRRFYQPTERSGGQQDGNLLIHPHDLVLLYLANWAQRHPEAVFSGKDM